MEKKIRYYDIILNLKGEQEHLYIQVQEDKTICVSKSSTDKIKAIPTSKEITNREYVEALNNMTEGRSEFKPFNLESRIDKMKE
ncbi:MAG: hypothetical protein WC812_03365 [Candidatus Pacearchaeota archaeon]|jgi:type VI protein secretion system component Hcp